MPRTPSMSRTACVATSRIVKAHHVLHDDSFAPAHTRTRGALQPEQSDYARPLGPTALRRWPWWPVKEPSKRALPVSKGMT